MPGKKYRSIKRPKVYEGLRRRGMSKTRAAKIANAGRKGSAKGGKKSGKKRRKSTRRKKR